MPIAAAVAVILWALGMAIPPGLLPTQLSISSGAKSSDWSELILKRRTDTDDHVLLAQAWQAANTKARELGWTA